MQANAASGRYKVFKVRYELAMPDPDVPGPRYHTVIFVETDADGSGVIHHVTGDLVSGMKYDWKKARQPELSGTFYNKEHIGYVGSSSYPQSVDQICIAQPAPPRQKAFNTRTLRYEPIKPDGSFYAPGEARPALIKCTEWTERQAIPALQRSNVIIGTQTREGQVTTVVPSSSSSRGSTGSADGLVWDTHYRRYKRLVNGAWVWN